MDLKQHQFDRCGNCERIPRSQVKLAEWNPRNPMTPDQRRRLTAVVKKHGLIQPLIVSRSTMTLLSGHQRISVLDKHAEAEDYLLPVVFVDADEAREREICVAMNNADAQSTWDMAKLGNMFKSTTLDIEATGFDPGKLKTLIPDIAVQIPEVAAQLQTNKQHWQDEKKKSQARQDAAYDRLAEQSKAFTPQTTEIAKPADKHEANIYETDDFFYIPFVFPDAFTAARVKSMMGMDEVSRDQDGRILLQIVQEWHELKHGK